MKVVKCPALTIDLQLGERRIGEITWLGFVVGRSFGPFDRDRALMVVVLRSLGGSPGFGPRMFGPLVARQGADHDVDTPADELRLEILVAVRADFAEKFPDHLKAELSVGHFPPAEFEGHLDLHIFAKEVDGVLDFNTEIVRIDLRT